MTVVDTDDLALLGTGFEAALRTAPDAGAAAAALFDLGWGEVLDAAPSRGIAIAFTALGTTGSTAGILDDVMAHALAVEPAPTTAVLLPAPGSSAPPGRRHDGTITVDGTASARLAHATTVVIALVADDGTELVAVDASAMATVTPLTLDPGQAYHRVRIEVAADATRPVATAGTWAGAVAAGRVALAHELVAAARTMLELARQHAVDRVQFGRAIASFQAVRHRLADALVHVEGAAAVVDGVDDEVDPLVASLAKSLAGQAARLTATDAQQVLAGIGFTTDHPFHRWLKRTLVLDLVLGSSTSLPAEIGAELLRRGHAPRLVELGTAP